MPRRSTTSAAGPSTQIKQEVVKVKMEKVKLENVKGKGRAQTHEVEDDPSEQPEDHRNGERDKADGSQKSGAEDDNGLEDESPRGNKRRRVNGRGQSAVDDGGSQPRPSLPQPKTLPRSENGQAAYSSYAIFLSQLLF